MDQSFSVRVLVVDAESVARLEGQSECLVVLLKVVEDFGGYVSRELLLGEAFFVDQRLNSRKLI